jgi:hypothetical protein
MVTALTSVQAVHSIKLGGNSGPVQWASSSERAAPATITSQSVKAAADGPQFSTHDLGGVVGKSSQSGTPPPLIWAAHNSVSSLASTAQQRYFLLSPPPHPHLRVYSSSRQPPPNPLIYSRDTHHLVSFFCSQKLSPLSRYTRHNHQPWRKRLPLSSLTMVRVCARPVSPVTMLPELFSLPLSVVRVTMVS